MTPNQLERQPKDSWMLWVGVLLVMARRPCLSVSGSMFWGFAWTSVSPSTGWLQFATRTIGLILAVVTPQNFQYIFHDCSRRPTMVAGHGQGHGRQGPPPVRHGLEAWLKEKLELRERISFQENLCEHQKQEIRNIKAELAEAQAYIFDLEALLRTSMHVHGPCRFTPFHFHFTGCLFAWSAKFCTRHHKTRSWCRDEACDDFSIASGQCWMDHDIFQLRVSNANTSWVRVKSYTSEG